MNRQEIEFIRGLDPQRVDGTVQAVLMMENVTAMPFNKACEILLTQLVKEKQFLVKNNIDLSTRLYNGGES